MSLFLTPPSLISLKHPTNHIIFPTNLKPHTIICHNKPNKKTSDAELASDFAAEVHRLNTQSKERENAMKRSKQLLFSDLCNYLNMTPLDVKYKWRGLSSSEKLGLVKEFVCNWGVNFHPLSTRSVRDLVDEFVMNDFEVKESESESSGLFERNDDGYDSHGVIFPTLKKLIMGFSSDS